MPPLDQEFENNPLFQVKLLAGRVDVLTKEKEDIEQDLRDERKKRGDLETRVATMEKSFQRGAGALIVLPIIGTFIGIVLAYGKVIFKPWLND